MTSEKKCRKIQKVRLGVVAVDSGVLMLADPVYVESHWKKGMKSGGKRPVTEMSLASCHYSANRKCQLFFPPLKTGKSRRPIRGMTVVFPSGWGDGLYPVEAVLVDGCVQSIHVKFFEVECYDKCVEVFHERLGRE